ncbi:hypothetical protein M2459_000215 [Parabacteroides sp. PF5-5]|uniref:DUF262 domain-containing protein n=1 Tax=unclassified Parabacteroides TaxID=2649774 RepID=UPI0024739F63|nr:MULTISPECIES: DUF262 domain-containing protein [unclassified Parabacteroides]MDH6303883.1 hypothetical protein [Parabacteroides sp. PH5-39]MDH6314500.1 hypothetical protein [Parabacteroides sp. PF5-13]MDH6318435.1 hypothetical protein [Parabacteroides sp. PH5-13]MDH6322272.1 hypothetical protein [Parabacteroides sp. PH5-8]MDH6325648.1 hypothetical protein [Parabacteroides sp. PH5-41]
MVDYRVRSISLLDLVNDIRSGKLIPNAYFQRNLVWRDVHNKDFIKTILLGFPFPQIFISKGKVNISTMTTVSCIVDGQQRTNAIAKYIDNQFEVDGKYFEDLNEIEKTNFLKYEIAVIELDLNNDDPKVQDIFQRINRTSNSLSSIEKMASEYSTSEYMLVAKLLCDQININVQEANENFKEDPNIPREFYEWANTVKIKKCQSLFTGKNVFTAREISRKVHLQHTLNIMSTILSGFFNRNDKTSDLLNDYFYDFDKKNEIIRLFEQVSSIFLDFKFNPKSFWHSKSNFFSLFIVICNNMSYIKDNFEEVRSNLINFESNAPEEYRLAAAEAVNNKKERQLRNDMILGAIGLNLF